MNTGIQDMINLSWKLAMVLRNEASPELLKTYDEERLPIIRNVLRRTEALTDAIGSQNHIIRTIYNHVAPLIVQSEIVENSSATTMSQIG
ncbi:FAD-dependent monooxygenase, partial [Escherichia coli]